MTFDLIVSDQYYNNRYYERYDCEMQEVVSKLTQTEVLSAPDIP